MAGFAAKSMEGVFDREHRWSDFDWTAFERLAWPISALVCTFVSFLCLITATFTPGWIRVGIMLRGLFVHFSCMLDVCIYGRGA